MERERTVDSTDLLQAFRDSLEALVKMTTEQVLPKWLEQGLQKNGLVYPRFDRRWRPKPGGLCTLVTQSRSIHNFARGHALTGDARYLSALQLATDALVHYFRDPAHGGWSWSCTPEGDVADASKNAYGHAFVVFALAHAASQLDEPAYLTRAEETLELTLQRFGDRHGGIIWWMSREFHDLGRPRSQNPLMHLFEASLALWKGSGSPVARRAAERLWEFVDTRLRRPDGTLPEWYDGEWRELPEEAGGVIDVGHAFEWAFLLDEAVRTRLLPTTYKQDAKRFLELGLKLGFDREEGGIFSPVLPDGSLPSRRKGWWEQCEALRTLIRFATEGLLREALSQVVQTFRFVDIHYLDHEFGGWYEGPVVEGRLLSEDKGTEGKVDYHVVGLADEAAQARARLQRFGRSA